MRSHPRRHLARSRRAASQTAHPAVSRSDTHSVASSTSRRRKRDEQPALKSRKKREPAIALGRPRPANVAMKDAATIDLDMNAIPPWPEPAKIPYDVLLSIFQYAAYPLLDENLNSTAATGWLVKVALLRRDFLEPALSALYYNPPLEPIERAHALLDALSAQTDNSTLDYKRKIRYIDIDASKVLSYKSLGRDPLRLSHILAVTPMLRGLRINWANDSLAVRSHPAHVRKGKVPSWYGKPIFDLLDCKHIMLTEWKWNYVFGARLEYPWLHVTEIHQLPLFQRLKSLEICRIPSAFLIQNNWGPEATAMSVALGELPMLEDLTISNPFYLSVEGLLLLFKHVRPLAQLSFLCCEDLTSDDLTQVLATQKSLRNLTLNHNRSLDLGFLDSLRSQCPMLESLSVDLTLYSKLGSVRDTAPKFESLLPERCTPDWPHTLQQLHFIHLRKWDAAAASRFFNSLIDAAANLTRLREMDIRMSVDADWKDRISFRDRWEAQIPHVFRRPWVEPIRWTDQHAANGAKDPTQGKRSERLKEARSEPTSADSGQSGPSQGTCDRVDVRVENLRPMERQLDESNFLDDEPSGDEDYED